MFAKFIANDRAATAIEYGLLTGLIAVAIISGVSMAGTSLSAMFSTITGSL